MDHHQQGKLDSQYLLAIGKYGFAIFILLLGLGASLAYATDPSLSVLTATPNANGQTTYTMSLKIVAAMTLLTLLPALLMTMTSFTRIIIVLSILRQAVGIPNVPTNQVLIGMALILTFFVMHPVISQINDTALQPYVQDKINEQTAMSRSGDAVRGFMLNQVRKVDLSLFIKLSKTNYQLTDKNIPFYILIPAYLTSEIKTAFQIGFLLYLPFLIIDLVVSSVLMSMGMMMLSPLVISVPFKIMLFVLVNGWTLILGSLAQSFR